MIARPKVHCGNRTIWREHFMVLFRQWNDSLSGNAAFTTWRLHNGQKACPIIGFPDRDIPGRFQRIIRYARCHPRGFLLPGDIYGDEPVVWRLRSNHHYPEYQWLGLVQLEPAIRLSGQRSDRHTGMEWRVFAVRSECHGDESGLEWQCCRECVRQSWLQWKLDDKQSGTNQVYRQWPCL